MIAVIRFVAGTSLFVIMISAEMIKTVSISAQIPENRELHVTLPADVPAGPAEIVLVVSSAAALSAPTLGELADSEFFGVWRDRSDRGCGRKLADN